MTAKVRVLLVDDSLTVRRRLAEVIDADSGFETVGEATNGQQAIDLCLVLRPDVIVMDMMLPGLSGLAATEYIMAHCPTPILIVSASLNRGELFSTYDALAAGAVDVFEKPNGTEESGSWERGFLGSLRIVARVRVITHLRARLFGLTPPRESYAPSFATRTVPSAPELVVIGASTGGPTALVELFTALPAQFPLPVLVVMHIDRAFATSFAEWLHSQIGRSAAYARDGETLGRLGGCVRLAPPDRHLIVRSGRLQLCDHPPRHCCRPSIDVLFESVAREYASKAAACLLTGMGRDGATGLLELRKCGAATFAQDEPSCTVFGMPREAILLGAAERVMRPQAMAHLLGQLANQTGNVA